MPSQSASVTSIFWRKTFLLFLLRITHLNSSVVYLKIFTKKFNYFRKVVKMRFWILIFSVVYCDEKNENFDSKEVFNSTVYMSTLAEKAMKSIRYYIEVCWNFTRITWPQLFRIWRIRKSCQYRRNRRDWWIDWLTKLWIACLIIYFLSIRKRIIFVWPMFMLLLSVEMTVRTFFMILNLKKNRFTANETTKSYWSVWYGM